MIDYSKAFDTIYHIMLVYKLQFLQFGRSFLKTSLGYLSNRGFEEEGSSYGVIFMMIRNSLSLQLYMPLNDLLSALEWEFRLGGYFELTRRSLQYEFFLLF